jgi:hypothetical protein
MLWKDLTWQGHCTTIPDCERVRRRNKFCFVTNNTWFCIGILVVMGINLVMWATKKLSPSCKFMIILILLTLQKETTFNRTQSFIIIQTDIVLYYFGKFTLLGTSYSAENELWKNSCISYKWLKSLYLKKILLTSITFIIVFVTVINTVTWHASS